MQLTKRSVSAVALAAAVIWFLGALSIASGMPAKTSPFALAVVIPAFIAADITRGSMPLLIYFLAATPVVGAFLIWSFHLLRGSSTLPLRSVVLFVLLAVLCIVDLYGSWPYGLKYQGREQTIFVILVNMLFVVALLVLLVAARRTKGFRYNFAFHAALFAWLAWCAFPYLGELP
jgi:hypothetical protein